MNSGVYKITNVHNWRIYIGSSRNLKRRWQQHQTQLRCKHHENRLMQADCNEQGLEVFYFEVLDYIDDELDLLLKEKEYLAKYFDNGNKCYNVAPTAHPSNVTYKRVDFKEVIGWRNQYKKVG